MKREKVNKGFLPRRILAVLMIVMLIVSIIAPNIAWAEETATTTNGYYDASGEWHQGGDGTFSYNDGALILSKTAKPVEGEENLFEITLQVSIRQDSSIFSPSSIATVLVIDVSNSMEYCQECGASSSHDSDCSYNTGFFFGSSVEDDETRLAAAKTAAIAFLDAMKKDAKQGSGRYVTLVTFASDATKEVASWQDVTTTSGYNTVKNAIDDLYVDGGTNLDDGLGKATELINSEEISAIIKGGKNVIVLTDGKPTYYEDTNGSTGGNGSDCSKTIIDDTTIAADALKEKANVFTVCYDAESTSTYSGGPTVGNFLKNNVATPATEDITYAYNVDNADELIDSFMDIVEIELKAAGVTITDPMPEHIEIPTDGLPDGISYEDGRWSLDGIEPTKTMDGNMAIYTYKIIYRVSIDADSEDIDPDVFYPANKPTQLIVDGETTTYDFPVPGIKATSTKCDVVFNSGNHGSLEDEDNSGNVSFEDLTLGTKTPAAPAVTPDDGWYFTGWSPEISDTVTGDVIYVAQYSQKQVITLTANSGEVTYNGAEQNVSGFTVTGLPEGWTVSGINYSVSGKNAGTYTGDFDGTPVVKDENGNVVSSDRYTLSLTTGILTIGKCDLAITADSASKAYDGTALTDNGWTASGVAGSDNVASVVVSGSQTLVGQSANTASSAVIMSGNTDVTANYNITYIDGTLTVTKNTNVITITAVSDSKTYDGTTLVNGGYSYTQGILAQGDLLVVDVNGSQTNVGTSANEIASYKVMRGELDVTDYYTITSVNGTLEITKRDLTITADSASKVYDGTALTDGGWKDTAPAGLANGDEITSVAVAGSQTQVGQSANVASNAKVMRGNEDVTANYNITYVDGTLTVNVVGTPITITANSNSKIYDGLALIDGGYTFTQGVLAQGDVLIATVSGSQTYVGTSANEVVSYKVYRDGVDVTSYYTFAEPVDGTLTVTKIDTPIVILPNSFNKIYDGTALVAEGDMYTFTQDVLVNGDELVAEVSGSQLNVGSSASVVVSYKVMNGATDVTENYTIQCAEGILDVFPREITITADSASKYYDGTPLTADGFTAKGLADTDSVADVEIIGSQTNVGTSVNAVSNAVIKNSADEDVTANYTISYENGALTVDKAEGEIIVTAGSASKEYDGTPLTSDDYTITGNLANGDEIIVEIEGSQTFVGQSANKVVAIKILRDGIDVTDNYNIGTPVDGVLEITGKSDEITITAASDSKEYDGTPLTNDGYTVNGELAQGDELIVEIEGSQTNAGTSANKVVVIKVMRDGVDVTENYTNLKIEDGTLTVTKVAGEIIVTAGSASKEYDGTPLTSDEHTVSAEFANGDEITVVVQGSQTDVGTSENKVVSYKVMRGNEDVTANYTIVTVNGTLEVTKRELVITADSASKVYDGTALTDNGFTVAGLADGETVASVAVAGSQTGIGQSANVASNAVVMRGDSNVTANYDITYIDGTLTVSAVSTPIIITAGSAFKEYDGTPLTSNSYTFTQGVLAQGDELVVVIEGSQTDAGIGTNEVVSYKVMRGDVDVTSHYTFAPVVVGMLEVAKRDITITADSASKEYDGTALTKDSFTVSGAVADEQIQATVTGSQLFAGSSANVVSNATIISGDKDVTANYNVAYVDGTLTVEKRSDEITITAGSASKEYDGEPLTNDEYTVVGELADGDELVIVIEGSQTNAGTSANKVVAIKVIRDGVDVTENYENLVPADGTLTVNRIDTTITITAGSAEKPYDGTPLTNDTFTFTDGILLEGDELIVVIEGSQTEVGSSANKVVSVKVMRGELDVTDSYNIGEPIDGELVITAIVPETGDNTSITPWSIMMVVSLLTLFVLALTSRKQRAR